MAIKHQVLNTDERKKYRIIGDYINGKMTRKQASLKLGVTPKTISKLKVSIG